MNLINRAGPRSIALETTLLAHGLPAGIGAELAVELGGIASREGASAAVVGILRGRPIVGLSEEELEELLAAAAEPGAVPKANSANLGAILFRAQSAATTVSSTLELAAGAGVRIFATGGLGGVHRSYAHRLDISSDLAALTRFPVAVVASGVKSLLDVAATREALETLGIPVVGYRTERFPAFYLRTTELPVDARFDDPAELARFAAAELGRTGRAVLIVNPIPEADAIDPLQLEEWLREAEAHTASVRGGAVTPALLARLREISGGATLRANLSLVRSNVHLAAQLAAALPA